MPDFAPKRCPECGKKLIKKEKEDRERLYCVKCSQIIWLEPKVAAGVLVTRDDKVLMIKRGIKPHKGTWATPAGYLEYNENPKKAAIRELEEETNIKANLDDLKIVRNQFIKHPNDRHVVVATYTVERNKTTGKIIADDDAEEARFWNPEELRKSEKEEVETKSQLDTAEKALKLASE